MEFASGSRLAGFRYALATSAPEPVIVFRPHEHFRKREWKGEMASSLQCASVDVWRSAASGASQESCQLDFHRVGQGWPVVFQYREEISFRRICLEQVCARQRSLRKSA
jgi:hypothetical protein